MTFFVRGSNLLETLLYNTFSKEEVAEIFPKSTIDVRPVWELDNTSYNNIVDSLDMLSYSNRLVSYTRLIKVPEEGPSMIYLGGPKYEDLPENNTYYKRFVEVKTNELSRRLYAKEGSMWRSLDVISPVSLNDPAEVLGYRILDILEVVNPAHIDIEAFGAAGIVTAGLYYVNQWYYSSFRLKAPLGFFMSIGIRCKFRKAMNYTSYVRSRLYAASETYFRERGVTDTNIKETKFSILSDKYWDTLNNFKNLLENPATHQEWCKKVRHSAYEAFKCYNGTSFDVKKAYAIGFKVLKTKGGKNDRK